MQRGPLVEIRGSVSALIVVVVTNKSLFNCCCWAITIPNSGKHIKGILFSSLFFSPFFLFDMLALVHLAGFAQLCCGIELVIDPEKGASC